MRYLAAALVVLALGACQAPVADKPAPVPVAAPPSDDTCGATALRVYVGRPRSELPPPAPGKPRRMVCEMCPMTMDFNAERQTILYDRATDLITAARCG